METLVVFVLVTVAAVTPASFIVKPEDGNRNIEDKYSHSTESPLRDSNFQDVSSETLPDVARTHFFKKPIIVQKPLIVKKKLGVFHSYRDSSDEKQQKTESQKNCTHQTHDKLCVEKTSSSECKTMTEELLKEDLNSINNIERSIKIAKEAIENLQNKLKIMDPKTKIDQQQSSSSEGVENISNTHNPISTDLRSKVKKDVSPKPRDDEMATSASERRIVSMIPKDVNGEQMSIVSNENMQMKNSEARTQVKEKEEQQNHMQTNEPLDQVAKKEKMNEMMKKEKGEKSIIQPNQESDSQNEVDIKGLDRKSDKKNIQKIPLKKVETQVKKTTLKNEMDQKHNFNEKRRLANEDVAFPLRQLMEPIMPLTIKSPQNILTIQSDPNNVEMRNSHATAKSAVEDVMKWNQARSNNRGAYYGHLPAAAGPGVVGIFPQAKVSDCAIPLLLNCSPSIVHGKLSKPYPTSHPAYKRTSDENDGSKRDAIDFPTANRKSGFEGNMNRN